ncbi:inositol monophosphatase family protein [Rubrimonas cliftonensis]|uniref:Myo-inositol-1(Or 4)-monophosphatase n=1 Tax=Rubrimonas cliftonensis TaxID=89524 RepID=A0A1H3YBR6_9RHOB|nr:inositol monophosphatase family protein [Rubrimonas cliftonensis]SEA09075.1 myo-inositol-1(or 4)-monophosphatase [Rubrimonas cliftonensis]
MSPDHPAPGADRALLEEVAREGGAVAMDFFRRDPRKWEKPGEAGPVTEADLAVDVLAKSRLEAARPDYGWLSEETPDDAARLASETVFIVDPIDGTRAFIAGETGWCVALAVARAGVVTAAAAWFPALGQLYSAALGEGATRDGAAIGHSGRGALAGARALSGAAQLDPKLWPGGAPPVRRAFRPSLVHRMCLVADGGADAVITLRDAWEWDVAAGALIAAEAGCAVSDGDGAALRFNAPGARSRGLIAAPPALHGALLALRRPPAA